MTTEEFHGHFMAMLTGPKGPEVIDEIGAAVIEGILAAAQRNPALTAKIAGALQPLRDDVLGLMILAQLDASVGSGGIRRRVALKLATQEALGERLREILASHPDSGISSSLLADLGLAATEPAAEVGQ
jgi:hypothetical protein